MAGSDPNSPSNAPTDTKDAHDADREKEAKPKDDSRMGGGSQPAPSLKLLFAHCTRRDAFTLLLPAIIVSIISGGIAPFVARVIGQAFDAFARFPLPSAQALLSTEELKAARSRLLREVGLTAIELLALAAGSLLLSCILSSLWIWVAERNTMHLRRAIYEEVTTRPMEWFDAQMAQSEGDTTGAGGMMAKFAKDTDDIREATSLAMGQLIQHLVTILVALILALTTSWSLTLIILSSIPVILVLQGVSQALAMPRYDNERSLLARAATVTTTSLSAIATIKSFNAQASTYNKLSELLNQVRKITHICATIWGATSGGTQFVLFAMFVQGFWFGSTLVRKGQVSPGQVTGVFWACLIAASNLPMCIPLLVIITKGKNAAASLAGLLENSDGEWPEDGRKPTDRTTMTKIIPTRTCIGEFGLHNVTFAYPSRPDQVVLKNVSMFIPGKDMTFVVGGSGSGKSTIAQIVCGMYKIRNERTRPRSQARELSNTKYPFPGNDTDLLGSSDLGLPDGPTRDEDEAAYFSQTPGGMVVLDDQRLDTLDERWTRKHVALVSQQCILFDMSVHDNVAIGLAGSQLGGEDGQENKLYEDDSDVPASSRFVPHLSREKVVEACKLARLHDFISELPNGYDTILNGGGGGGEGEAGNETENGRISLSGGQKQRLAIARAWARDPTVLILDEATSALDANTRTLVFDAIRTWRRNKTTIVITHDLAQIAPADFVYVMKDGRVVQEGHRYNLQNEHGGIFESIVGHQGIEEVEEESEGSSIDSHSIRGQGHGEYDADQAWQMVTRAEARQAEASLEESHERGIGLAYPGPGMSYTPFVPYAQYPSIAESSAWMFDAIADISGHTSTPMQSYRHRHPSSPPLPAIEVHTTLSRRRTSVDLRGRAAYPPGNAAQGGRGQGAHVVRRASLQWEPMSGSIKGKSSQVRFPNQNVVRWSQKHDDSDGDGEVDSEEEKKPFKQGRSITKTGRVAAPHRRNAVAMRKRMEERLDPIIEEEKAELQPDKPEEQKPPTLTSVVKRFYPTVPNKWSVAFGLTVSVVSGTMVPIFSFLLATLMAEVAAGGQDVSKITRYALLSLLAAAGDGVAGGLKFYIMEVAAMNWVTSLRERCIERVLAQDKRWHDEPTHSAATISQVLIKDGDDASTLLATVFPQFITVVMMIGVGLIWAMVIGWQLTLVGLAVGPVFGIVMVFQVRWSGRIEMRNKRAREEVSKQYYNAVANVRAIRAMALESVFKAQFERSLASAMKSGVQGAFVVGCGVGVVNALIYIAEAALFYVGAVLMVREGYSYLRTLQSLNLVVFSVSLGGQLLSFVPRMVKSVQATHDFGQFLFLDTDTEESKGLLRFRIEEELSYNHVQFAYPTQPDLLILKDINFKVKRGECVAIVGPSGCGKSTIISLLQRLYEPNSGSIQTGEHSIASANVRYLREHIAVVSQQPALFDATVTDNITFGSTNTPFEDVQDAARAAQMHDWIMSQERGYETMLGEGAALISGGQAQRLQIARALVRKANVLVMDEATSALDPANQDAIMDTVMAIKEDRITLVVTHKLAVMKRCDRILVVQDGVIAEEGPYQELINRRGAFFNIASGEEWFAE